MMGVAFGIVYLGLAAWLVVELRKVMRQRRAARDQMSAAVRDFQAALEDSASRTAGVVARLEAPTERRSLH